MLLRTIIFLLLILISSSNAYKLCVQSELGDAIVEENCGNFMGGVYIPVNYSSYYPNAWEVVKGSCKLNAGKYGNAEVSLSGDCTVKATFATKEGFFKFGTNEVYTYDAAAVTNVQGLRGIVVHFSREKDRINYGSEVVLLSHSVPYGEVYTSKNQSFNANETNVTYLDGKGRLSLYFADTYTNDVYYLIPQASLGVTSGTVEFQVMPSVSMSMKTQGEGEAYFNKSSKSTYANAIQGDVFTVWPEAAEGWSYTGWTSSYCDVEKSSTDPLTFTFLGSASLSCSITANFEHWDIYPITTSPQTFTFNKSASLESGYYVLRTVFEAEEAGTYTIQAKSNRALYYIDNKDDASFSTTNGSAISGNWSKTLTMEAGSSNYFLFRQDDDFDTDTIQLVAKRKYALQIDSLATGEYASKICDPDSNYRISAVVPNGKMFDKWVVEKGTCSVANATSATSTVMLSSDCTVKASFKFPPILEITETPRAYNLAGEGYLRGSDYCGNMRFVPTTSGTYRLNYTLSVSKYLYLYNLGEKTDFSYVFATTTYSKAGNYTLFLGEVDSDGHYFVFRVTDTSQVITANVVPTYKIRLENDAHSSAKFDNGLTYDSTHVNGETLSIDASSDKGYRFSHMKVISGECTLDDSTSQSAQLTIKGNCTVMAFSEEGGQVYPISTTESEFNYEKHRSEADSYYGIRTVFTPEKDGVYTVRASGNRSVVIKSYDETFTSQTSSNPVFTAEAGTDYYFFIHPNTNASYYSSTYNDTLEIWVESNVIVTASVSGSGSILIDGIKTFTNSGHIVGDSVSLEAVPENGSRFDHWEKVSGSCSVRKADRMKTDVQLNGDCSVKAHFAEAEIYEISDVPKSFHYIENGAVKSSAIGIQTYFDVPEPGTYKFLYSSNVSSRIAVYSNDEFTDLVNSSNQLITFTESGRYYPFFYCTYSYSNLSAEDSVSVYVVRTNKVHVDTTGSGTIYINGSARNYDSTTVAGDMLSIQAVPSSNSKFLNWEVSSGLCTVINEKATITTVKVNGDCNIVANFGEGTVYKITETPVEYTISKDYYSGSPTRGVRFYFEAPADGQYGIVTKFISGYSAVQIDKYSDDETFSSMNDYYRVNDIRIDTVDVTKGEKLFFKVENYYNGDTIDVFSINYIDLSNTNRYTITFASDSICNYSPSEGYTDVVPTMPYDIYANSVKFGYRFDHWNVESGTASFSNKNSTRTSVSVTSDVTLKAIYEKGLVHTVDTTEKSFTYNQDYYSDYAKNRSYEVALKWVAPDTGSYLLDIDDQGGDIYVYSFQTDSTFSRYSSSNFYNHKTFPITVTTKGTTYYWTVAPYSSSYYSHSFKAVVKKSHVLNVLAGDNGYINGSRTITMLNGVDTTIAAYGSAGYLFDKWTVVSGKATIKDSTARNTKASIEGDATIKANFKKGPVQEIGTTEKTFTFYEDKFTDYSSYLNNVAMTWTAPSSGWYFLEFDSPAVSMYDFGTNETFSKYEKLIHFNAGSAKYAFEAESGVARYFALGPTYTSDSLKSFTVKISKAIDLTLEADSLMGYVKPASTIAMTIGNDTTIIAYSNIGYIFDGWSVVSGKPTLLDSTAAGTSISITDDATVKAKFRKGIVHQIDTTFKTFTFDKDYFTDNSNHKNDVAMTWTAPDSGWYYLVINTLGRNLSEAYLWNYDTSSTFKGSRAYYTLPINRLFQGVPGVPLYWSLQPYYTSDASESFSVKIERAYQLTVTSDGNGYVSPRTPAVISELNPVSVSAASNFGYKFDKWTVVSGTPVIADSIANTTIVTSKNDATVKALFTKGSVQSIGKTEKTFTFADDYYTDSTGYNYFVFMSWTAPDTNWYFLEIEPDSNIDMEFYSLDTTLSVSSAKLETKDSKFFVRIKGVKDTPLYWALGPANVMDSRVSFSAKITVPYVLTVESDAYGVTYPSGDIVLPAVFDTTIMAVPYGGYQFNKWTITKGSANIKNPVGATTVVTPTDTITVIKANYVMDLTTVPKVKIHGISAENHPEICSVVSVVDSNNGRSIIDLDSTDFVLFEDGKSLPATVTDPLSDKSISIVFVVDESGSVSAIQDAVREYVTRFANEMQPYDRGAIVGYVDTVRIVQDYTTDKEELLNAIKNLRFTGRYEDIALGAYHGVEHIGDLAGPKAVIVFSDGMSDHKQVSASKVVDLANQFATSVYTISFNESAIYKTTLSNYGFDILKDMSNGTGGRYYETVGIEETREILAEIRRDMQARYLVCHTTPDTIINGDTHHVEIGVNYHGKASSDTGSWYEKFMPPKIRLTEATSELVGKTIDEDTLEIGVYATSKTSLKSVEIFIRKTGTKNSYTSYSMKHVKDSLWTFTVPSSYLETPGFDFYAVVTDALGQNVSDPKTNPTENPYTIYVENEPSEIELVTDGCVDITKTSSEFLFKVADEDGLLSVLFFFRNDSNKTFTSSNMGFKDSVENIWSVIVYSQIFKDHNLEYYVQAIDNLGVVTRWGATENHFLTPCEVPEPPDTLDTPEPPDTLDPEPPEPPEPPAAPDVEDVITISNADTSEGAIARTTENIRLALESQDFTEGTDTLSMKLSCLVSGDIESNIKMIEQKSGYYEPIEDIGKNEYAPKRGDGKISCKSLDTLVAEFKDPVYETVTRDTIFINDDVKISYEFLDSKGKSPLDSAGTSDSVSFVIRIKAPSKSLYAQDTLKLILFTDTGDSIMVKAAETGVYTKEYEYATTFYYVENKKNLDANSLDAVYDYKDSDNRIKIQASVVGDKSSLNKRDSLIIYSDYIGADEAEIYDSDLDGTADSVRVHFIEPFTGTIAEIDSVFWNVGGKNWREPSKKATHLSKDRRWVETVLEEPFEYGLTAAIGKKPPYLRVSNGFGSRTQKITLLDKIGPVPTYAEKRPGRVPTEDYLEMSSNAPFDTLFIKMSEPVFNDDKKAWKDLFRYSKTCEDAESMPIPAENEPEVAKDGKEWTFVLNTRNLLVGNCLRTNPASEYTDSLDNTVGVGGVKIEGYNSDIYLYKVEPNYKLTKGDKTPKWIKPGKDKWVDVPDSLQTILVSSIAPYKAKVYIYDNLSNLVTTFTQKFTKEEMEMSSRGNDTDRSKIGFLHWNMRSKEGRKVGNGVYIWRIDFTFDDGYKEYRIVKTGLMRKD